jgi:acylphosphatase
MRRAQSLGLGGWVRNRSDGSVEAAACGEVDAVERFIDACRKGPPGARVDAIDQVEDEIAASEGFAILPTL